MEVRNRLRNQSLAINEREESNGTDTVRLLC